MKKCIILLLIILVSVYGDLSYLFHQVSPQSWDQSAHLINALSVYDSVVNKKDFSVINKIYYIYPAFFYITTIPFIFISKYPPYPILINQIYSIIIIISIYIISSRLFKSSTAGFVSSISISTIPLVIYLRRMYLLDFAVLSMSVLSISIFMISQGVNNIAFTVLSSFVSALTFLTKQIGLMYIFPFYLFFSFYISKISLKKTFIFLILCIGFISSWFLSNRDNLSFIYDSNKLYGIIEKDPKGLAFSSVAFYFKDIFHEYSFLITLLSGVSLVCFLLNRKNKNTIFVILLSFITIVAFLCINPNKDHRYSIIFSFYIALMVGGFVIYIRNMYFRRIFVVFIFCYYLFVIFISLGNNSNYNLEFIYPSRFIDNSNDWNTQNIFDDLRNRFKFPVRIAMLVDYPFVNGNTYQYYARLNNLPITFLGRPAVIPTLDDFKRQLQVSQYVFVANDIQYMDGKTPLYDYMKVLYDYFNNNLDKFILVKNYQLQNNIILSLYYKKY
jgi:4-amino-4-deoxy-L-arabinose transferase-like glycosyltransferase